MPASQRQLKIPRRTAAKLSLKDGHEGDQDKARTILGVPEGYQVAICSVSAIPLTARSSRSANRNRRRSKRLSTRDIGDVQRSLSG